MPRRKGPKGKEYKHCCAFVKDPEEFGSSRMCHRAAPEDDDLCSYHAGLRKYINTNRYVITISCKGDSFPYKKRILGKVFYSREDAELWISLNGHHLMKLPRLKSWCIEPAYQVERSIKYYGKNHGKR